MSQLRLRHGKSVADDGEHQQLQQTHRLIDASLSDAEIKNGVPISVDVSGDGQGLIGYRAKRHANVIDMDNIDYYNIIIVQN